jgi:hypothetical protein
MLGRFAIALVAACALLASTGAPARPLYPQPLKWVKGDATGLAVADFDNDGHLDVVVPDRDFDQVQVHLGNGDGSFTALDPFDSDDMPDHAVAADFDADGNADLALAKFWGSMGLSVRMGNGDGTFGPETDYAPGSGAQAFTISLGDFNGDGVHDLLAMGGGGVVALGVGNGTFTAFEVDGQPYYAGVADFDGDGLDDYAYGCLCSPGRVTVELSNGDGTFYTAATIYVDEEPATVTAGDVSGDGVPDLVVGNHHSDDVCVFFGNGDGTFGPEQRYSLGVPPEETLQPWVIAIEDLDRDGLPDLVVSNWWSGGEGFPSISLLYGTGGGQFAAAVPGDTMLGFGHGLALADFDHDGETDLVRTRMNGSFVSWLFGDGEGAFATNRREALGDEPTNVAVADLDGDGRLDVVSTNEGSDDVSVLLADGAGTFAPERRFCVVTATPPCPAGSDPSAVAIAEMTGDAHPDLAVANAGSDTVSILAGDGAGGFTFTSSVAVSAGMAPGSLALGDLDNDGDEDLAVVGEGSTRLGVYLGNEDGTFAAPPGLPVGLGLAPTSVAMGLLDGDSYRDLVVANNGSDNVKVLLGDGDGTFTTAPTVTTGSGPTDVTLGDVNGDLVPDMAVSNDGDNSVQVFPGAGDGSFGSPTAVYTYPYRSPWYGPYRVRIADFDGDGIADLGAVTDDLAVFAGNGDATFEAAQTYVLEGNRFAMGDFDLDSRLDVFGQGAIVSGTGVVLLSQSGPRVLTFESDKETLCWPASMGALSYDVYRGDLSGLVDGNGDGLPDGGYGSCMTSLDPDPRDTFFEDATMPSGHAGFFYLTSVIDAGGYGGIGTTSAGLPRVPSAPCP